MSKFVLVRFLWLFENREIWVQDEISFSSRPFQLVTLCGRSTEPNWMKFCMQLLYSIVHGLLSLFFQNSKYFSWKTVFSSAGLLQNLDTCSQLVTLCGRSNGPNWMKFCMQLIYNIVHGRLSIFFQNLKYFSWKTLFLARWNLCKIWTPSVS